MPQNHIVHVTNITADTQRFFYKSVEPAEIEIGKVLRRQTSNWQPNTDRSSK